MNDLSIKATEDTPAVELSVSNGVFKIFGRSLPENAITFYVPVFEWLTEYIKNPNQTTEFVFMLDYFNSSSSKQIYNIIHLLQELHEQTDSVKIKWMYRADDDLMLEEGEEFAAMFYVPIELELAVRP